MRNLKGLTVDEVAVVNKKLNIFEGRNHETGFVFTVKQPGRLDLRNHKKAWKQLSPETIKLYTRQYGPEKYYDSKHRCTLPKYREGTGWENGFLPLIMVIDGKIVGFGDFMFMYGDHYKSHDIPEEDIGCSMNLCVIDKYHGLGIGTFYSFMSVYIAKYFGAQWALGYTKLKGEMWHMRSKQGWELVKAYRNGYAVIRKRL